MELRKGIRTARKLRSQPTDAERRIWSQLRGRRCAGFKFRRQFPISGFVADFVCLEALLVVEVDGGQHVDQAAVDTRRTAVLEKSGFRVLRFWNDDVLLRLEPVMAEILRHLEAPP